MAVELFAEHGLAYAFHQTGITKTSIARWAKAAGTVTTHVEKTEAATAERAVRIAAKRAALQERLLDEAAYCIDAIHNEHIDFKSAGPLGPVKVVFPVAPAAAVQHYATALAIFIDKFRLENGEVTGRESVEVDDVAGSRERLTQQLARIADRSGADELSIVLN